MARAAGEATFIPLDAIVVREAGLNLFTVNEAGEVSEHTLEAAEFMGDFVAGLIDLPPEALVVIRNNRTLQAGARVSVK